MAEQSVFSSLFPQGIIESSSEIIRLKNKLDNSIPSLLFNNGFSKIYNETNIYFIDAKSLILFYRKKESKSKKTRREVLSKCVELKNNYPNHTVIIGYLIGTDTANQSEVTLHNMTFKIMVGETLLKFLLPYDIILQQYTTEVSEYFHH